MAKKKQKVVYAVPNQPVTVFWARMKMVGVGKPYLTKEDAIKDAKAGEVVLAVVIPPMTVIHSQKTSRGKK